MFYLGISSAIPLAFLLTTVKILLIDNDIDIKTIGFFSLVTIPYSVKFLWAPVVDSIKIPYLTNKIGSRKSWIVTCQFLLSIFILILSFHGKIDNLSIIIVISVFIGYISATQDIAIDAYRIEYIAKDNQGIATSMYIYGYRIGLLIAGAVSLVLLDIYSWKIVCYFLSILLLIGTFLSLIIKENINIPDKKVKNFIKWINDRAISPLKDFLNRSSSYKILAFIILFKLGDVVAGSLTVPFLIDIKYSKIEIATIVKTFGLFATLLGVLCGGVLVKLFSIKQCLWLAVLVQMFSNLAFYYQAIIGYNPISLYFVVFIENCSGGVGDIIFVSYLSALCNKKFIATQYAILSSLSSLNRGLLSSFSGVIVDIFNWDGFFLISTILSIPVIILLYLINKKNGTIS